MKLRNESTPEAKSIWDAVDKAASHAPEWLKRRAEEVDKKLFEEVKKRTKGEDN